MNEAPTPPCGCIFAGGVAWIDPACRDPAHRGIARTAPPVWPQPSAAAPKPAPKDPL